MATTTITVRRVAADDTRDGYDPVPAAQDIATGVRAHLSYPSGSEERAGGSRQTSYATLLCDPVDLAHTDTVLDEQTGIVWAVTGVAHRVGLGLDHVSAGLLLTSGAV